MERGILTELCLYITKTFFLISEIFSSIFLDIFLHPPIGPILVYRTKELRLGCFSSRHEQKIALFSTPIFGDHLLVMIELVDNVNKVDNVKYLKLNETNNKKMAVRIVYKIVTSTTSSIYRKF